MTVEAVRPAADDLDLADVERRIKAIFIARSAISSNGMISTPHGVRVYFAPAFFPNSDPVVQQLNAAVLFAATFLMRPLGGWLFVNIADRYGRRLSLTLSVSACASLTDHRGHPDHASIASPPGHSALARIN